MTKSECCAEIAEYLRAQGYRPEVDEDGDIRFNAEGVPYFVIPPEDNPYYNIITMGRWWVQDVGERTRMVMACNEASRQVKCAKVWILKDTVAISIEAYCASVSAFLATFARSLSAMQTAAQAYEEAMG